MLVTVYIFGYTEGTKVTRTIKYTKGTEMAALMILLVVYRGGRFGIS